MALWGPLDKLTQLFSTRDGLAYPNNVPGRPNSLSVKCSHSLFTSLFVFHFHVSLFRYHTNLWWYWSAHSQLWPSHPIGWVGCQDWCRCTLQKEINVVVFIIIVKFLSFLGCDTQDGAWCLLQIHLWQMPCCGCCWWVVSFPQTLDSTHFKHTAVVLGKCACFYWTVILSPSGPIEQLPDYNRMRSAMYWLRF